ncbi:hypothetical protein BVY03_05880 [bacterium K02(2017)]|nr:hypothetical protein BVY03_05880 [bacterium K02(2017)]
MIPAAKHLLSKMVSTGTPAPLLRNAGTDLIPQHSWAVREALQAIQRGSSDHSRSALTVAIHRLAQQDVDGAYKIIKDLEPNMDWVKAAHDGQFQAHIQEGRGSSVPLHSLNDHPSKPKERVDALTSAMRSDELHRLMAGWTNFAYATHHKIPTDERIFNVVTTEYPDMLARNAGSAYGLLVGADYLASRDKISFIDVLDRILAGELDPKDGALLDHLLHATWAAAQRFREPKRMYREPFKVMTTLDKIERDKDTDQVLSAARLLRDKLSGMLKEGDVGNRRNQLVLAQKLLKDPEFVKEIARQQEAMYNDGEAPKDEVLLQVESFDQKIGIAREITPFLGVVGAAIFLYESEGINPYVTLDNLAKGNIHLGDSHSNLIISFVAATWMAGEPFLRTLEAIQDKATFILTSQFPQEDLLLNLELAKSTADFYRSFLCTGGSV